MSDITSHLGRQVTVGMTTLCSARKDGSTLACWFYIKRDTGWRLFDIRDLYKDFIPANPAMVDVGTYEQFLVAELTRVAELCELVGYRGPR